MRRAPSRSPASRWTMAISRSAAFRHPGFWIAVAVLTAVLTSRALAWAATTSAIVFAVSAPFTCSRVRRVPATSPAAAWPWARRKSPMALSPGD